MIRPVLLSGLLLISGIFLVDSNDPFNTNLVLSNTTTQAPSNSTTKAPSNTTTDAPSNTTTQAPSNTTTLAPSNTTTQAPSNTTTQAPSNTTTQAPSNTTTQAPSNTTTHAPSNTTTQPAPPLPTGPSPPSRGNYSVRNDKEECIMADMGLSLELTLQKEKRYFDVDPSKTNSNGTCGESKSNLLLTFNEGFINFVFVKENKEYYISEVTVTFSWRSTGWNNTATNQKLLSTPVGYSVKCENTPIVKLGDTIKLTMVDVKLQAFEIQKESFGKEAVCSYDRNMIVVAIAVTVLIVIIIGVIIYYIWHKKKSSGYQRI